MTWLGLGGRVVSWCRSRGGYWGCVTGKSVSCREERGLGRRPRQQRRPLQLFLIILQRLQSGDWPLGSIGWLVVMSKVRWE